MITLTIIFTLTIIGSVSAVDYLTSTDLTLNHNSATPGDNITLTANVDRLTWGVYENAPAGIPVQFRVLGGSVIGTNTTDSNGIARYSYNVLSSVSLEAEVVEGTYGGNFYDSSQDHEGLEVHSTTTSLSVSQSSTTVGSPVTLSSRLREGNTNIQGQLIHFFVNGTEIGSNATQSNGRATFSYNPSNYGTQNIMAIFYGYLEPDQGIFDLDWDYYHGSSSDTQTLTVNDRLTVTKSGTTPVVTGANVNGLYTITVRNNMANTANNVQVTDNLPFSISGTYIITGGTPVSFTGNVLNVNLGNINAGSTKTITINGIVDPTIPAGVYHNNAVASFSSYTFRSNNLDTTVNRQADLGVIKSDSPDPVIAGNQLTYTIIVRNNGPSTINQFTLKDTLPSGFLNPVFTPSIGSYNSNTGEWAGLTLATGQSVTLTITGTVDPAFAGNSLFNTVTVSPPSGITDSNMANNTATSTTTVNKQAHVVLTKTTNNNNYTPNYWQLVTFTIAAHNNGPSNVAALQVTDKLPNGLTFVSANTNGFGTYNSTTGVWDIGSLANGTNAILTIVANVTGTGSITNWANVTAQITPDSEPFNKTSTTLTVPAAAHADVDTFFADYNQFVNNGYTIVPIITAKYLNNVMIMLSWTNMGPDPVTYSRIINTVNGLAHGGPYYWRNNGGAWTYWTDNEYDNEWDWYPTWDRTLNVGDSIQCAIVARVTATGIVTNSLTTAAQTPADPIGFDTAYAELQIPAAADVSVIKDVDDNTPQIGQTIMYTITAFNSASSPDDATGVKVIDNLPDGVTFVSASSSDYDPNTDTWNVGDLLIGQFKQLFIWVTVNAHPTSTSYTNTATISGNEYDWNLTNNNESETIYSPVANITLAKEFRNPDNWDAGPITTAYYLDHVWTVIKAYNNGPDTATNVTIQDILPTGLTNTDNWYCVSNDGGITWKYVDGSYNFGNGNWTISSIASGAEYWLAIWTQVTSTGDKINQAAVTQLDQYYTTLGTASATLHVPQEANLNLHKEFRSDYAVPESVITTANYNQSVYAILSVTNNGPDDATNININDVFTGFNYQGTYWVNYLDGWILGDTTAPFNGTDWTIPYLGKGQTIWLALAGIVEDTGGDAVTNTATETAQNQYHNGAWPSATASLDVPPAADVAITKEFRTGYQNSASTTTTANYHTPVWVMVHVTNAGPDAAEGLKVTDILPAGLTYQSMYHVSHDGGLTWTAADTFTAGVWNIGTMLNGADYWIAIFAQVDGHNETITNIANKTQTTFDWNATNDEGNATLTVPAAADVYVNTSISKNNPTVGEKVVVRVKVGNNGPDSAQNVIVTYKIPANMEFVSLNWEAGYPAPIYDPATRTVTWNLGDLAVIDPWMDITLKAVSSGSTSSDASVTSDTYDPVPANNVEAVTITVKQAQVNAATVPMQPTGVPIVGLVLALLAVFAGLVTPKRK